MEGRSFIGVGLALGIALGAAIGIAVDNLVIGIGLGVAIGAGLGVIIDASQRRKAGRTGSSDGGPAYISDSGSQGRHAENSDDDSDGGGDGD